MNLLCLRFVLKTRKPGTNCTFTMQVINHAAENNTLFDYPKRNSKEYDSNTYLANLTSA